MIETSQNTQNRTPLFYEKGFVPGYNKQEDIELSNPMAIYNFLLKKVYKQDVYCSDAAMILYNHVHGHKSCNVVCGPSGCGKTYVWENLKSVYEKILIVNGATLTAEGWKGDNKVSSFLSRVNPRAKT